MPKIEWKKSGTKTTLKVTPKYPLESVRPLDNMDGKQGSKNAPHYHINIGKIINRILKGGNNGSV